MIGCQEASHDQSLEASSGKPVKVSLPSESEDDWLGFEVDCEDGAAIVEVTVIAVDATLLQYPRNSIFIDGSDIKDVSYRSVNWVVNGRLVRDIIHLSVNWVVWSRNVFSCSRID